MSANNPKGPKVMQCFNRARADRSIWDSNYQELKELIRPDGGDFNRQTTQGVKKYQNVYDGVAVHACEEFASGLHSQLSPPTERWFELGIPGFSDIGDYPEALQWLETVADIIYSVYSDTRSNFNPALHEAYLDLGAFGTGTLLQEWSSADQHVFFKTQPLASFFFVENSKGFVDQLFVYVEKTGEQILEEYEKDGLLKGSDIEKHLLLPVNQNRMFKVVQHIYPNTGRQYGKMDKANKAYASITVVESTMDVLRISGYDSFPYAVTRWVKIGGETYGRGPGHKCQPDLMALQTMARTLLKAGQKAVDPPLVVPNDGFMEPLNNSPGALIWKEPGAEKIETLDFKGNLNFGMEECEQKRTYIRKCFYEEWFKRFRKNREQSATEVLDDRDEMLRFLAPMLGRQQTELLGPTIKRTYLLLREHNLLPPAPDVLMKRKMEITYISPAARAQQGVKADRMSRFMQDITPLAQSDPTVMDGVKTDQMVAVYASCRGVPRIILRNKQEIAQIQQQRAQQKQMEQVTQAAEPASKSILNLAQAQNAGGGGMPGGPL